MNGDDEPIPGYRTLAGLAGMGLVVVVWVIAVVVKH